MDNENWQPNNGVGNDDETKLEPGINAGEGAVLNTEKDKGEGMDLSTAMNVGSETELNPEISVSNEMRPISSPYKQEQSKDKKHKKRTGKIIAGIVVLVVTFVLGSAVTVLVQNMLRNGDLECRGSMMIGSIS